MFRILFFVSCFGCCSFTINAQGKDNFIHSKQGVQILNRKNLLVTCLKGMHKDKTDPVAVGICECKLDKMDYYFTNNQYRNATVDGLIDISGMIGKDSFMVKEVSKCYENSGRSELVNAEANEEAYIDRCAKSIQKNTNKKLDSSKLLNFCACRLALIKSRKMSDSVLQTMENPNSLLFYEMMYTCGNPYEAENGEGHNWSSSVSKDIIGPSVDTLIFINLNGMTYLKAKTGSMVQFWLFDTGASDLLIGKEMEAKLKAENYIKTENYLGTAEYEMANGIVDTCRKYRIDNFRIGKFVVNNITVAASDKARRIIIGRSLLNKFSTWVLDNRKEVLILRKED